MEQPSGRAEKLESAVVELFDLFLLEERFAVLHSPLEAAEALLMRREASLEARDLGLRLASLLVERLQERSRVRAVGGALSAERCDDPAALRALLLRLGPHASVMLMDLCASLRLPQHRRVVVEVLVKIGASVLPLIAARLKTAEGDLQWDLFRNVDRLDPPNVEEVLRPLLKAEDPELRGRVLLRLGRKESTTSFAALRCVLESHAVPQMRANAGRQLAAFPPERAAPVLLVVAKKGFEERTEGEQRAILFALAQLDSGNARAFLREVLEEKSSGLRRRAEKKKLLVIAALAGSPRKSSLEMLEAVARDTKRHAKEVREAAEQAAQKVKAQL